MRAWSIALTLLVNCKLGAPDQDAGAGGVCGSLTTCQGTTPGDLYGQPCDHAPGTDPIAWHGLAVCCDDAGVHASCIERAKQDEPCDPAQPISCASPLLCVTCDSGSCCEIVP